MRIRAMRKALHVGVAVGAVIGACCALSACPTQPSYSTTITPIYAATSLGGLFVFNGAAWTNYTNANTGSGLASSTLNSVVISGSGAGAMVFAGGNAGVSEFNGTAWTQLTTGLGSLPVNSLLIGASLYASTAGGVSVLNGDGTTWTTSTTVTQVNDVFLAGTYTLVAANAGLFLYNGTTLAGSYTATQVLPLSTQVTCVFVDSLGDIIAGTNRGLAVLPAGGASFGANLLSPGTLVHQVTADAKGDIYVATSVGLYILGTGAVLLLPTPAYCVCVDGAGTIYAGTGSGLLMSKDGGTSWTTELPGQQITSVATTAPLYSF
jgi:ligand-binding sensor domain-containing protein